MHVARLFIAVAFALSACASPDDGTRPESPVATLSVSLSQSAVKVGTPVVATAALRDTDGNAVDRAVTWESSNPLVATVSSTGAVTPVGAGSVFITARSEGKAASATLAVTTSVGQLAFLGPDRVRSGEPNQFGVQLRGSDGALIERPVTWTASNGTISPGGEYVSNATGTVMLRATVENITYLKVVTSYGSNIEAGPGWTAIALESHIPLAGVNVYPLLEVFCSPGSTSLTIRTFQLPVNNGGVSISFDGAAPMTEEWLHSSLPGNEGWNGLAYPGATPGSNVVAALGGARAFALSYTDPAGAPRQVEFRVAGLMAALDSAAMANTGTACVR